MSIGVNVLGFVFRDADAYLTSDLPAQVARLLIRNVFTRIDWTDDGVQFETFTIEIHGTPLLSENILQSIRLESPPLKREDLLSASVALTEFKTKIETLITRTLRGHHMHQ